MVKLKVINLDVWGNEKDGFEINNFTSIGTIEVSVKDPYEITARKLKNLLIKENFIRPSARKLIELSDLGYSDYFYQVIEKKNGRPIYNIQLEETTV